MPDSSMEDSAQAVAAESPVPRRLWLRLVGSGVVVGVIVAVVIGVGRINPGDVLRALERIGLRTVALATLVVVVQMLLIMSRLWFLFPAPRPGWLRVAYAFSLGQVVNNFLPVRSGDAIKVMLITGSPNTTGRSFAETFGVLLADSLIDITALTLLVLCVGPNGVIPLGAGRWSRLILIGLIALAVAIGLILVRRNARVARVLRGMSVLRNPVKLVGGLLLSTGNWTAEFVALRLLSQEVGGHLGFAEAIRVLFLFNLGIVFPISIANLGTFEVSIAIGLGLAGVAFSTGLAIGTAYHGVQIAGIVLLALASLVVKRLRDRSHPPRSSELAQ
jgi:uncharacterized membrane protein YbhN (UPF0104 family)